MGCWNGTCAISNLPIISGEDVKVVLLHRPYDTLKQLNSSAYCYPNGIFHVAAFAFDAKYNDYGGVEDIKEDINVKLIEQYFQEKYKKIKVENKQVPKFKLTNILQGIERGSLEVLYEGDLKKKEMAIKAMEAYKDMPEVLEHWREMAEMDVTEQWRTPSYNMVMIRKDVWDGIIKNHKTQFFKDVEDRKSKDDYYQTAQEWVAKKFKKYKKENKSNKFMFASDSPISMSDHGGGNFMVVDILYNIVLDENIDYFQKLFTELTLIQSFMSATRKGWMPVSGAGSQSAEWKSYLMLNTIVNKICKEKIKEYGSEDED